MNRDNLTGFGTGLIVGAIAGAILGVLFAPKTGTETRKMVKEEASELYSRGRDRAGDLKETIGARFDKGNGA